MKSIAVVGAGMAGLACARRLVATGRHVRVFDKGRSVGGRVATRRVSIGGSEYLFDHGAQFFTARDPAFRAVVDDLIAAGAVQRYANTITALPAPARDEVPIEQRFVGVPGMGGLAKGLASGLHVETSCQVTRLQGGAGKGWVLSLSNERQSDQFDAVVLALPAEQAAALLRQVSPSMATEALAAHTLPCWTALLAFAAPLNVGFEAARVTGASPLAWVARMPESGQAISCWVAQATPAWSRRHLEESGEAVGEELARAFSELTGIAAPALLQSAHRWRYAQVQTAAGSPFAWDPALRIGACGDWRLGPRIELAWKSGDALGAAISLV